MPARPAASSKAPRASQEWDGRSGHAPHPTSKEERGQAAKTDWSLPPQLWQPINRLSRLPASERGRGGFFFSQALFPEEGAPAIVDASASPAAPVPKGGTPIAPAEPATLQTRSDGRTTRRRKSRENSRPTPVSESRLRQLARRVLVAQEDERRDLSREILNEVVQTLVGVEADLLSLGTEVGRVKPALKARADRSQRLVESSVRILHRLAGDLRPTALDDLGLIPALHAYSRDFASANDLRVHLIAYGAFSALSEDVRTALFRIAQEALADALHHARANEIRLQIFDEGSGLRLEVADNGRGNPTGDENRHELGIVSMTERIEMLGGRLRVESSAEGGNVVRVTLPREVKNAPR